MPNPPMVWRVTVLVGPERTRRELEFAVVDGEVVVTKGPPPPYVLPPSSDQELAAAMYEARRIAKQTGLWP